MEKKFIPLHGWLILFLSLLFLRISAVDVKGVPGKKYDFSELFTIGLEEAKEKKDEPYVFYKIISIDCDKEGSIYALDYSDVCVKKFHRDGTFSQRFFRKGKGPEEISNAFSIAINRYTGHIFILQDFGFTLKEFDPSGNYVKYHVLPGQFFGTFRFLQDKDHCLYMNKVPREEKFYNFHLLNLAQKKIVKKFATVGMVHELNFKQYFAVSDDSVLWTSRGDKMTLLAFDMKTGNKIQEIRLPGKYKENKLLKTSSRQDSTMVIPILYNVAQPFFIDDQLFSLVVLQEYPEKNGKIEKFPTRWKRIIYQVNGSHFVKLGELEDGEDMYIGTVSKNRLVLFSNEPYGRIKVLEFKEKVKSEG